MSITEVRFTVYVSPPQFKITKFLDEDIFKYRNKGDPYVHYSMNCDDDSMKMEVREWWETPHDELIRVSVWIRPIRYDHNFRSFNHIHRAAVEKLRNYYKKAHKSNMIEEMHDSRKVVIRTDGVKLSTYEDVTHRFFDKREKIKVKSNGQYFKLSGHRLSQTKIEKLQKKLKELIVPKEKISKRKPIPYTKFQVDGVGVVDLFFKNKDKLRRKKGQLAHKNNMRDIARRLGFEDNSYGKVTEQLVKRYRAPEPTNVFEGRRFVIPVEGQVINDMLMNLMNLRKTKERKITSFEKGERFLESRMPEAAIKIQRSFRAAKKKKEERIRKRGRQFMEQLAADATNDNVIAARAALPPPKRLMKNLIATVRQAEARARSSLI